MSIDDASAPTPVSIVSLIGQWVNADPDTRSIKRLDIECLRDPRDADLNSLLIRIYNSMDGGASEAAGDLMGVNLFCKSVHWDNEDVVAGLVYHDSVFAEYVYALKFLSENDLLVDQFTIFKDGSERHHYFVGERFVKVAGVDLPEATDDEQLDDDDLEDEPPNPLLGRAMPLPEMIDLEGNIVSPDRLRGKALVIDFFATWCGPCRMSSPALQKLHETYGPQGLVVIGASASEGDEDARSPRVRETVAKYAQQHHLTYLVTYGNDAWSRDCGVGGYPTFFLVDRAGIVREVVIGYGEGMYAYFEKLVQRLLA